MSSVIPATQRSISFAGKSGTMHLRAVGVTGHPPVVHDPERQKQGIKQDHNPRRQESRPWPVQGSAWKNPTGPGQKSGPGELADS